MRRNRPNRSKPLGSSGSRLPIQAAAFLAASLAAAPNIRAQEPKPTPLVFGASTELVYVRFHIEKKGGYVPTIGKDQLRVLEDGKPQTIAVLESPGMSERKIPTDVTLALDVSSSVLDEKLLDEGMFRDALLASLSQAASVRLCAFGGELICPVKPTRDIETLMSGFREAIEFGRKTRFQGTRLYSSVVDICHDESPGEERQRAIVIISDGGDNQGGEVDEALAAATENDVRIYAIKISAAFQGTSANSMGRLGGHNRAMYDYFDLDRLAAETGGQAFEPAGFNRTKLAQILRKIATEITMEHVVGYVPQGASTAKKRRVKVELADKSIGSLRNAERTITR